MTGDPPLGRLLTAEDVVRRIAAESAFISANGEVGIRLRPAVALVRQYGDQFRRAPPRRQPRSLKTLDSFPTFHTNDPSAGFRPPAETTNMKNEKPMTLEVAAI